jgi:hypothetical protein
MTNGSSQMTNKEIALLLAFVFWIGVLFWVWWINKTPPKVSEKEKRARKKEEKRLRKKHGR